MTHHPKRPRDMMQLAKMVGDIATGEANEPLPDEPTAKQERGAKGGRARAATLSRKRRIEIARKGGKAKAKKRR